MPRLKKLPEELVVVVKSFLDVLSTVMFITVGLSVAGCNATREAHKFNGIHTRFMNCLLPLVDHRYVHLAFPRPIGIFLEMGHPSDVMSSFMSWFFWSMEIALDVDAHIDLILSPGAEAEMLFSWLLGSITHSGALVNAAEILCECYLRVFFFPCRDYPVFMLFFYRDGLFGCLYGLMDAIDDLGLALDTDSDETVVWDLASSPPPSARMFDESDDEGFWSE